MQQLQVELIFFPELLKLLIFLLFPCSTQQYGTYTVIRYATTTVFVSMLDEIMWLFLYLF